MPIKWWNRGQGEAMTMAELSIHPGGENVEMWSSVMC